MQIVGVVLARLDPVRGLGRRLDIAESRAGGPTPDLALKGAVQNNLYVTVVVVVTETAGPEPITVDGVTGPTSFPLRAWLEKLGGPVGNVPDPNEPSSAHPVSLEGWAHKDPDLTFLRLILQREEQASAQRRKGGGRAVAAGVRMAYVSEIQLLHP
jgi:hypothetical protein